MSITNEVRRSSGRFQSAPFRSTGRPITTCLHCEHYRRNVTTIPHRRLASVGLVGCCIRPEGLCGEVGR